jgi:serine/threonine-protein kinase
VTTKVEPPRQVPTRPAAAVAKAEPPKPVPARTAKPPDRAVKRPLPSDKLAKASGKPQPLDPYTASASSDPTAAYKIGLQQYARGDTGGALVTLRGSLSSNPGFAPTWRAIGLVYEKIGNKAQARSAFRRYLQLSPDATDADQIRDRMERLGP